MPIAVEERPMINIPAAHESAAAIRGEPNSVQSGGSLSVPFTPSFGRVVQSPQVPREEEVSIEKEEEIDPHPGSDDLPRTNSAHNKDQMMTGTAPKSAAEKAAEGMFEGTKAE